MWLHHVEMWLKHYLYSSPLQRPIQDVISLLFSLHLKIKSKASLCHTYLFFHFLLVTPVEV